MKAYVYHLFVILALCLPRATWCLQPVIPPSKTLPSQIPNVPQVGVTPNAYQTPCQIASQIDVPQLAANITNELSNFDIQFKANVKNAQDAVDKISKVNQDLNDKLDQLKKLQDQQKSLVDSMTKIQADIAAQKIDYQTKEAQSKAARDALKQTADQMNKTIETYKKSLDTALGTGYLSTDQQKVAEKKMQDLKDAQNRGATRASQIDALAQAAAKEDAKKQMIEQNLARQSVLAGK